MARHRRERSVVETDRRDASYPINGVSSYSRESATAQGSPYAPHLRAQEMSARQLVPYQIEKLKEMAARIESGSPEFRKRIMPAFEEKRAFLARLIIEAGMTS
jgi:hypothetical protein